jgi:hypothetical protein
MPGQVLPQLDEAIVVELPEFRMEVGERFVTMFLGVTLDLKLHGPLLSTATATCTSLSSVHETCRPWCWLRSEGNLLGDVNHEGG